MSVITILCQLIQERLQELLPVSKCFISNLTQKKTSPGLGVLEKTFLW